MTYLINHTAVIAWLLVLLATVFAAVLDARRFAVPNWLTFPVALLGFAYFCTLYGRSGFVFSLTGFVGGLVLLLVPFLIGSMGAGDLKLLAAVGAWLGLSNTLWICLIACLGGGVYSLVVMFISGEMRRLYRPLETVVRCLGVPFAASASSQPVEVVVQRPDRRWRVLPFALMIAFGTLVGALGEFGVPFLRQI